MNYPNHPDEETAVRELFAAAGPDTQYPAEWEERLRLQILAEAKKVQEQPVVISQNRLRWRWALRGGMAAAAVFLAAVAVWWFAAGGTPAAVADFSAVLQKVTQAMSVQYVETIQMPGKPEMTVQVLMSKPGRARMTWNDGQVHIMDYESGKGLKLFPDKGTARSGRLSGRADPLAQLEDAQADSGRFVRQEKLDGMNTDRYEVALPGGTMQVWVDPVSQLPVRIETRTLASDGARAVLVMKNFRWNQPLEDSLFSLNLPGGYAMEQPAGPPSEQALVYLLKTAAELNGGQFPDKIDTGTVAALLMKSAPDSATIDSGRAGGVTVVPDEEVQKLRAAYRQCQPGLTFVEQAEQSGRWAYSGKDIRLGEADKIVCRWGQGQAGRAIYGDLQVKNLPGE